MIENLSKKLNGELPVTREELIELISSWGREGFFINHSIKPSDDQYDLSKLDVSEITSLDRVFRDSLFNGDISKWDTSNVTDMSFTFYDAKAFNQNINLWDTSNVTDMSYMFYEASAFNQPLNSWDVSSVTNMAYMFQYTNNYNRSLNSWNVSNVIDMKGMFFEASAFAGNISSWNTSNVTHMGGMFWDANSFNKRFNNNKALPDNTKELEIWFKENRDNMKIIAFDDDLSKEEKSNLSNFFDEIIKDNKTLNFNKYATR